MRQAHRFDPRQEMGREDFELQYKRDTYLQDVELHHHDFHEIYFLISGDVECSSWGGIGAFRNDGITFAPMADVIADIENANRTIQFLLFQLFLKE